MTERTRTVLLSAALALLAVALFDLVAYQLLPPEVAAGFHPYRCPACVPPPAVPGGGTALRDYYVADPERGFDIAPNRPTTPHYVDGTLYPVWSNSLGCFDTEPRIEDRYVYLAGDSFAWGFTPFEDKLGTVLERRLGVPVLKCGVSGAGELHELAKMRRVIAAVGGRSALVVDAYFANDVQDDLAYPSATVVDGWLATKVLLAKRDGRYEVQPRSSADLEAAAAAADAAPRVGSLDGLLYTLSKYSLSFDIVRGLLPKAGKRSHGHGGDGAKEEGRTYQPKLWERDGRFWYADNPYAARNRAALREMKGYADGLGVPLLLLLIPPKEHAADPRYYDELKEALRTMGIRFVDAAEYFGGKGYRWWELYWPRNGHLNPTGNRVVGDLLADRIGPLLPQVASRR